MGRLGRCRGGRRAHRRGRRPRRQRPRRRSRDVRERAAARRRPQRADGAADRLHRPAQLVVRRLLHPVGADRRPHDRGWCSSLQRTRQRLRGHHGAGGAGREHRRHVGGDRGDHRRDRVPRRSSPDAVLARGVLEVRDHRLGRDRARLPRDGARRLRGATPPRRIPRRPVLAVTRHRRAKARPRCDADRGRAPVPRLRDEGRPGAHAHVAAGRAQPGPGSGLGAHVGSAALGRLLRHPATQGRRRPRARDGVLAEPVARRWAPVARGRGGAVDRAA